MMTYLTFLSSSFQSFCDVYSRFEHPILFQITSLKNPDGEQLLHSTKQHRFASYDARDNNRNNDEAVVADEHSRMSFSLAVN